MPSKFFLQVIYLVMKSNYIIHDDSLDVLEGMTDEQVGKLFRKIRDYHKQEWYVSHDPIVDICYITFKNQFDRDEKKYEKKCEKNRENVEKRRKEKQKKLIQTNTNEYDRIQTNTNYTDNDNDNEKDNDNDNEKIYSFTNWDDEIKKTVLDFIAFRKEIKKPITDRWLVAMFNKINKFCEWYDNKWKKEYKISVIQRSIINNWQWVFDLPKEEKPFKSFYKDL